MHNFEKIKLIGLTRGEMIWTICLAVLTLYRMVTNRQMMTDDGQHSPCCAQHSAVNTNKSIPVHESCDSDDNQE